jgi:excisionase family DNA binding protein
MVPMTKVAEDLDLTTRTIRRWIAEGRLTGYKIQRRVYIDAAELDAIFTPIRRPAS